MIAHYNQIDVYFRVWFHTLYTFASEIGKDYKQRAQLSTLFNANLVLRLNYYYLLLPYLLLSYY